MINGKKYSELVKELQSMRPKKTPKGNTGFWYYPIEEFVSAMDAVFGNGHYNTELSEPYYRQVASGQETVTVRCTLTIIDDEGRVAKRCDGYGDREIQYAKNGGRADLGNLTSSASANAFKDACKWLGIFGYRMDAKDSGGSEKPERQEQKARGGKKPEVSVNFVVTDMFYQHEPNAKGEPIWKLPVKGKADGEAGEVIFYNNIVRGRAERFNQLFAHVEKTFSSGKGTATCKLKVTPSGEMNGLKQYVFKDFAA